MKHTDYEKVPPVKFGKKKLIALLCLLLLVTAGIGATVAYFRMTSGPVINTFHAGSVGAEIKETVVNNTKEAIQVKNTGASPVYVRVRLVSYYERSQGEVDASQASPELSFTAGEKWTASGSYYYYTEPLAAGATTTDLLGTALAMSAGQVIEVLADTVQATPARAAIDAWGVDVSAFAGQ